MLSNAVNDQVYETTKKHGKGGAEIRSEIERSGTKRLRILGFADTRGAGGSRGHAQEIEFRCEEWQQNPITKNCSHY